MKFFRIYKILVVFKAYQLNSLLSKYRLAKWSIFFTFCLFWVRKKHKNMNLGERLCLALQELGPVWIKFGQMISTRKDLLPQDLANALVKLQDNVEPFDGRLAIQLIESALGKPIDYYFANFNITPLASASIAQVHRATLKSSGANVVIKVLRPNILPAIQDDISLMYWLATKINKKYSAARKLHLVEIVEDYEKTLLKELDLQKEAYNTSRLRSNFYESNLLYFPYVYPTLSRKSILVEEYIQGIPISNIDELKKNNVNLKLLAERGVQAFFTQVFRDNFFHADMHPGNIFVDITEPNNPRYIGIDCAVVGELSKDDQRYLAENFLAFFNRDYRKIADIYIASGWVPKTTDAFELENAMRIICEPAFSKPLSEISFAQILLDLFKVARQFDMEIQPQLTLLEKTLFYIEGIGRELYPQLDLWTTAKPFLEKWYKEQYSINKMVNKVYAAIPDWQFALPDLPHYLTSHDRALKQLTEKIVNINAQLVKTKKQQFFSTALIACLVIVNLICVMFIIVNQ